MTENSLVFAILESKTWNSLATLTLPFFYRYHFWPLFGDSKAIATSGGGAGGAKVKALWKKMLLTAPALVLAVIGEATVSNQPAPSLHNAWPFLCGIGCGMTLMICGFNWRRRPDR
jgi:hypothetical protein